MSSSKIFLRLLFPAIFIITACGSTTVNVKSSPASSTELYHYRSFGIVPLNAEDREIERKILAMIRERLEKKGLKYVNKDPDFLVATQFFVGIHEEYMPPTTLVLRDFTPDQSGRQEQDLRNQGYRRTEADRMSSEISKKSHTVDGYVNTKFYQNIQVYFIKMPDNKSVEIAWHGEVDSRNKKKDILAVAPPMLDELLQEYPEKTGKPGQRTIKLSK